MWWWCHHHIFSGISYFWGSGVHQNYIVCILAGCGIKFHIQRDLLLEIWVKTQGDMSKIQTKKVVFFLWQICQFNHYCWLILLKFYWFLNSNPQKRILACFLIRPILDPKFPLMGFHNNRKSLAIRINKEYGSSSLKLSISAVSVRQCIRPPINDKKHSNSDKAKSPIVKNIKFWKNKTKEIMHIGE